MIIFCQEDESLCKYIARHWIFVRSLPCGRCIEQFLMHGFDSGGTDIPHSFVEVFSDVSRDVFDTKKVSVGATNIRTE